MRVEKLGEWFGTPMAAAKTLIWLMWASFLVSLLLGGVCLVVLAVEALVS